MVSSIRMTFAAFLLTVSLSGCANNADTGALIGTIVGVVVGAAIGDGAGQVAAMVVGSTVGAIAGAAIGQRLDEAEKLKASNAATLALGKPSGEKVYWSSDTNKDVKGWVEPVSAPTTVESAVCRNVREVTIIGGQEKESHQRYCWKGNKWDVG